MTDRNLAYAFFRLFLGVNIAIHRESHLHGRWRVRD